MLGRIQGQVAGIRQEVAAGNLNAVIARFADLLLVGAIAAMVGMMMVPLPTWLLDIFLTIDITGALIVLMVSIYIANATQIASYPTLLLVTTLYRLALDISATRLILLNADAGAVIDSFGHFVVQGNFVVGAVIFLIITLVQFIVITKGAERVAEVSARFTLDAMPGKQMAIDADMRAGLLDFQQARKRRRDLERESQFYGAMDGAMKFVKGDAIAALIITAINIIGGLIIGVAMNGMDVGTAVQTYSILTIGSGLVSQIPALLISISAGMVVTRVASETEGTNLGQEMASQFTSQPRAITIGAVLLLVLALIPGMPTIPFLALSGVTGLLAYGLRSAIRIKKESSAAAEAESDLMLSEEPQISMTIPLALNVSEDLTSSIDLHSESGRTFTEQLVSLRNSLYFELGVIYPSIRINGNSPLPPGTYQIWLNEVPVVNGQMRTNSILANDSAQAIAIYGLTGEDTANPATGKPAAWIPTDQQQRAAMAGLQTWNSYEILLLHLSQFLKRHARDFLGPQEVQAMVDALKESQPALVEQVVPKPVPLQQLTEILQRLVNEGVSIRDLKSIFQALSQWGRYTSDTLELTEHARDELRRRICYQLSEGSPLLYVYQLDVELEEHFRNSIRQSASGSYLSMDPQVTPQVIEAFRSQLGNLPPTAQRPVMITDADIRHFVRAFLSHHLPDVAVISYGQITSDIQVQPLGTIALNAAGGLFGGAQQQLEEPAT